MSWCCSARGSWPLIPLTVIFSLAWNRTASLTQVCVVASSSSWYSQEALQTFTQNLASFTFVSNPAPSHCRGICMQAEKKLHFDCRWGNFYDVWQACGKMIKSSSADASSFGAEAWSTWSWQSQYRHHSPNNLAWRGWKNINHNWTQSGQVKSCQNAFSAAKTDGRRRTISKMRNSNSQQFCNNYSIRGLTPPFSFRVQILFLYGRLILCKLW